MKLTQGIFIVIHILSVAAMVILLLTQAGKEVKRVPKGFLHSGLTALVAGIVMVAIHPSLHKSDPIHYGVLNMGTIFVKLVFLLVILYLAFTNEKKGSLSRGNWWTLLGLTVVNIALAGSLK
jgi:preprotein translocase subunit SecG